MYKGNFTFLLVDIKCIKVIVQISPGRYKMYKGNCKFLLVEIKCIKVIANFSW